MSTEEEGFASRWSRKKREVAFERQSQEGDAAAAPPLAGFSDTSRSSVSTPEISIEGADSTLPVGLDADTTDEQGVADSPPVLTDADMPPLESIDGDSDVSGFFSKGVSSALRQAALRRVFSSPRYNVRDGLNDYDGDYTVFEPLGDTVTADMKYHAARKEADRLAALEEEKQLEAQRLAETRSNGVDSDETDEEEAETEEVASASTGDGQALDNNDGPVDGELDSAEEVAALGEQTADGASTPETHASDAGTHQRETLPT